MYYAVLPVIIGLVLTAALTRTAIRGFRFFRTTLFLPQLIAGVVIAQAWIWIYASDGPLNRALELVGLGSFTRPWLGDFTWALPSIGAIGSWVTFGLCMVLFIAGVQKIPTSLYDAARVDGAGAVREFFAVTLPGLRGEILVAFVLTTINALRSFDIVYNTTAGGPRARHSSPRCTCTRTRSCTTGSDTRPPSRLSCDRDLHPGRNRPAGRRPGERS